MADVDLVGTKLTFGFTPTSRAEIERMGAAAFIEDQLSKSTSHGPTDQLLNALATYPLKRALDTQQTLDRETVREDVVYATLIRAVKSPHQLYEMMCQLWFDHFNINLAQDRGAFGQVPLYQDRVIRPHAMGTFRDLLAAVIGSPAMLFYLSNDESNANSDEGVNENLGREILELHTLGIDENGNQIYSQTDVEQASLALAGWSIDWSKLERTVYSPTWGEFEFRNDYAYTGTVSLLNGQWTSQGLSGKAVADSMIDFLATHPQTARHVAYKICRRFVADRPSDALISSVAQVYLDNDTAIVPVLRHLFATADFAASSGQKFRRGFEFAAAGLRAIDMDLNGPSDADLGERIVNSVGALDHSTWQWLQPDGYPDTADAWLGPGRLMARWNYCARITENGSLPIDYGSYRPEATTVGELIAKLAIQWGLGQLSTSDTEAIAASGRTTVDAPAAELGDDDFSVLSAMVLAHPVFNVR